MFRCFGNFAPVLFHLAVGSNPNGGPDDTHGDLAVHFLLPECFVSRHHFFFRIAQQRKRDVELCCKFCMGCFIVGGYSQDNRIEFLEFAINVTESLGFLGSPGCVVLGIKIDDHVFAFEIL